ncbi:MAG: iron chelate uptake ABC transporter family permease subunit [Nocardioides sp.]|uniref:FecCD family ABC transporter permease n=1 Tax=Nocardioides sp. TaxID=35761 RepID=UPI0039E245AF
MSSQTAVVSRPSSASRPALLRTGGLVVLVVVLALSVLLSLAVGSKSIPFSHVFDALLHGGDSDDALVVRTLRVPRTLLGVAIGVALGLAGALMQALTRNPLADPGILGVNAGASAAVVTGIGVWGVTSPSGYVWLALAGAAIATVAVFLLGSTGRAAATPVRLALAGTALSAVLSAYVSGVTLLDQQTFNSFRFWNVGALAGRDLSVLRDTGAFMLVGAVIALGLARSLNAFALGDETGKALGANLGRTRALGVLAVTLLCGAATAAAGPIGFVGLTIPHVARLLTGPDQRWVLPYSALLAPILLLLADVAGRVIARPGEIEVGIVTAFIGAPVFIYLARQRRMAEL